MQSEQFAQFYNPSLPEDTWRRDGCTEVLAPSRQWSTRLGESLHSYLAAGEPVDATLLDDYAQWVSSDLKSTFRALNAKPDGEEKFKAFNEVNYHVLNSGMLAMWSSLMGEKVSPDDHLANVRFSRDSLAQMGLSLLNNRERTTTTKTGYSYFSSENERYRRTNEGMLTEYDAGLVLLNAIKKDPNLTVVPAPMQFEHGLRADRNVDFVVIDIRGHAIGVQTKATLHEKDLKFYDNRTVVIVSGREDLGNVLAKRTNVKRSDAKTVGWAGLICAHVIADTATQGSAAILANEMTKRQGGNPHFRQNLLINSGRVRQMLGGIRPNMQAATRIVGERVLAKLYEDNVDIESSAVD